MRPASDFTVHSAQRWDAVPEDELLADAAASLLIARMDKQEISGPVFAHGDDSCVWDIDGKEYLDFNSGQMCSALGHRREPIVEAIKQAADTLIHAHSSYFNVEEIQLARALADVLEDPLRRSMFLESGSDSNEVAMAIARKFTGRYEVASPHVSFHGFSDATRSVTYVDWHKNHGPYLSGTYAMMAPYCYRCPIGLEYPSCDIACLDGAFDVLDAQVDAGLAAVISEPLFSAGGVIEPPEGWWPRLRERCHERGALLIADEAQTGLGKLGSMWATQGADCVPDIITMSKHFGGGVSISATATTDEIADTVQDRGFSHGHSHTSDPLACAAARASVELIASQDLPAEAARLGADWRQHLDALAARHELIGDIRGRGLLQGIELVADRDTKEPAYTAGKLVEQYCLEAGLLFSARRGGSVLRFVPPWTTTPAQLDRAAEILDAALTAASSQLAGDGAE